MWATDGRKEPPHDSPEKWTLRSCDRKLSSNDRRIHVGASILTLGVCSYLASEWQDQNPSDNVTSSSIEYHRHSKQVDEGEVTVEMRPDEGSISEEQDSNDWHL